MSVLIRVGGQPFGLISAAAPRSNKFTVDDTDFVESIAHVLAAAIERRRAELAIRTKALHDPLTGLPNRSLLLDRLNQALNRLRRTDNCLALLFADVDRFKLINDSFGHAGGDRLLAALALRLRGALRPEDTVARLGGDEFVVICEGLGRPQEAEAAAERMAGALDAPFVIDGQEVFVTLSIGVHVVNKEDTEVSADIVLRDADIAMYQAKEGGRARYEVFSSELRNSASDRRATESALRTALEHDEFRLLYQPVVTVFDGALIGVEALVRWDRPEFGVVGPGEFISVAEDIGVVVPIGSWVLERACRQAARWARGRNGFFMSVNLSPRQLREPSLVADVSAALQASGLHPNGLCLELNETTVMEDTQAAGRIMSELKDLGVRLAIDDFGTGYSSFAALKRLPIDVLKVDRTFVDGMDVRGEDHDIVETILRLADVLGLHAVAEGVERTDQLAELQRLGCWGAQGYHIAPPRDAGAVDPLFALAAG